MIPKKAQRIAESLTHLMITQHNYYLKVNSCEIFDFLFMNHESGSGNLELFCKMCGDICV